MYIRILFFLGLCFVTLFNVANAHYPHDVHEFITLSPFFSTDGTVFVSQKQGASIRPHVALVSRNKGITWRYNPAGMDNTSKFTSATVSPLYDTDNTVYMTSEGDGVYRSTDQGNSWTTINQGLPTLRMRNSLTALDNNGLVNLYVSGKFGGLYKTVDSGSTWDTVLANTVLATAFAISPNYAVDGLLIAGEATGLMHISTDSGVSFSQITDISGAGYITKIIFAPDYAISGVLYVATSVGLYRSDNAAASFVKFDSFATELVYALAVSPDYAVDRTVFAATPAVLYKSTDAGVNWSVIDTKIDLSDQTATHYFDIQFSENYINDNTVFFAAFEGIYRTTDGGNNWLQQDTRPPDLVMDVALTPDFDQDGLMLVATYGGGFYVSQDAGVSWSVSNIGVSNTYAYQVDIKRGAGPDPVLIATQQNNSLVSTNLGASWTRTAITGVLPNLCLPSALAATETFATDSTMIIGCRKDGIIASYDGGNSWQSLFNAGQLSGGTITSAKLSPDFSNDLTMFFTDTRGNFQRSQDAGVSWQQINNGLPNPNYWFGGNSIALSPDFTNDNSLLGATAKGLYLSYDTGNTWLSVSDNTSPVATGVIEHAAIAPDFIQQATVLASVRGKGLFRSGDYGANWQQVGNGLLDNSYELKGFEYSPTFTQDGVIIGFGHNHIMRSTDRGDTFALMDIPFVRHEEARKQSVSYVGYWQKINTELASGTTIRANAKNGNLAYLLFWGTGVSWIGVRADMLGVADVYIDGQFVASVDQYSLTPQWGQTLYSASNLTPGLHVIYVVTTNTTNPNASANWTVIDAFDVYR